MNHSPLPASNPDIEALLDFPSRIELPVQWGEMDAFRHVNNVVYFRWFESARVAHFQQLRKGGLAQDGIGPVLGRLECRYRSPLTYPDTVVAATRFLTASGDRATMLHAIYSRRHQRIVAEGEGLLVWVNLETGKKVPIPAELMEAIRREGSGGVRSDT